MLDADSLPFGIVPKGEQLGLGLCGRERLGLEVGWRERVGVGLGAGLEGERLGLELCWTAELFSMKAFYSLILFKEASSAVLARLKPVPITVNANAAVNNNAILLKPFFLLCF